MYARYERCHIKKKILHSCLCCSVARNMYRMSFRVFLHCKKCCFVPQFNFMHYANEGGLRHCQAGFVQLFCTSPALCIRREIKFYFFLINVCKTKRKNLSPRVCARTFNEQSWIFKTLNAYEFSAHLSPSAFWVYISSSELILSPFWILNPSEFCACCESEFEWA